MRVLLAILALLVCLPNLSFAHDENGEYMVGGGVGGVSCNIFISSMASAQVKGGLNSIEGVDAVLPFISYVLGFQTGYNVAHPSIRDIFSAVDGNTDTDKILFWVEDWCKKNPKETFGFGLIRYASEQAESAK